MIRFGSIPPYVQTVHFGEGEKEEAVFWYGRNGRSTVCLGTGTVTGGFVPCEVHPRFTVALAVQEMLVKKFQPQEKGDSNGNTTDHL